MEEREALVSELMEMRARAVALLAAKLEGVANQIKEATARTVGELEVVLPPDHEALFPLGMLPDRVATLTRPVEISGALGLDGLRRLDAGRAQSEVLQELLRQLEPWCGPRAIVVFKEGQVSGWSGAGFPGADPVRGWRGAIKDSRALTQVLEGTPVRCVGASDVLLGGWLGADAHVLAVPMSLRGKVVGATLAVEGEGKLVAETVQLLVYLTGLLMETLSIRTAVPTPALADPVTLEPLPAEAVPVEAPVPEPDVFAEAAPAPPPVAPAEAAAAEEVPVEVEEAPVAAEEEPVGVEGETVPPEAMQAIGDAGATVQLKVPVAPVVPPRSPEEERRHEEAKRFARLLVSEIRLYNEQAVQDGKAANDIYMRLREDIDRSREMYEQRVPPEVRASSNYFFEELVRILADGDPDALGL